MGSWDWDLGTNEWRWDEGQHRIFGIDPKSFPITADNIRALIHPDDWSVAAVHRARHGRKGRAPIRPSFACCGRTAKFAGASAPPPRPSTPPARCVRVFGVTIDITDRKEADERQVLLAREVDHRARNALAVIQSIIRLTRAKNVDDYVQAIEGRIKALARAHTLLVGFALAWRRSRHAGHRGACAISRRRQDQISAGRIFRCSRRPRRAWRWRCTSLPPTRPNMARCPHRAARSLSTGNCASDALIAELGRNRRPRHRPRRRRGASA